MKKFMCAALLLLCLSALHHSCNGQVSTSATKDVKAVEKAKDDYDPVEVIENEYYDEAVIVDGEYYYYPMEALDISSGKGVNVGIRGINTRPIYTWADENLYGKVQSYVETTDNYRMTKKFDENGRIVYYNFQGPLFSHDVYPLGCPVPDKKNFWGSQIRGQAGGRYMLDHKWLNPVHLAECNEASFVYNTDGNIAAIYHKNQLLYEFEYDESGRLVKELKDGKPIMKITWDDGRGDYYAAFSIKFYTAEGYDSEQYKYAWKSNNTLARLYNDGIKEFFYTPEFTFYDYPQVKMVLHSSGNDANAECFFYDTKRHVTCVVSANNKIKYYNDNGILDFYYNGQCIFYKYNERGDVCSQNYSKLTISWPWSNSRTLLDFTDYIFNYDFDKLPIPEKETVWRYFYDDHGNWVKKEKHQIHHGDIDIDNLEETIIREYVYYE